MRVYLASPANQMQADCMAGQHVLESFALTAAAPWMARYRATFASSMLDSGAFSVMASGKSVDLGAYVAFALERRASYAEVVNLDVISGDVAARVRASQENLEAMRTAGLDPLPVFHQGEPWSVLEGLASCGKVGLGFQRPIREPERFLDGCFSRLPAGTKVHGFAMANARYAGRYPFASVDGATWLHELRALMSVRGQGADVLRCLTPAELLRLVVKKYERMPAALAWKKEAQGRLDL
jgi:hypothetical protein